MQDFEVTIRAKNEFVLLAVRDVPVPPSETIMVCMGGTSFLRHSVYK
jgi:hypothetical protein